MQSQSESDAIPITIEQLANEIVTLVRDKASAEKPYFKIETLLLAFHLLLGSEALNKLLHGRIYHRQLSDND